MFVFNRIQNRAANGLDLALEFSTLGEYGFLPPDQTDARQGHLDRARAPGRSVARPGVRSRRPNCSKPVPLVRPQREREHPMRESSALETVPRVQVIGALRTPRLDTDWAA